MRWLLDTHTLLWWLEDQPRISQSVRNILMDSNQELLLSMASLWEIAIKVTSGKLELGRPFEESFPSELNTNDIHQLPTTVAHLVTLTKLPYHHRDPFDRLIVAQAMTEHLPVLSIDSAFDAYPVQRIW